MKRALLIVLDSVGIGHAPDAATFGDEGADTIGHIRGRLTDLDLPHLDAAGLSAAWAIAAGANAIPDPGGDWAWAAMREISPGKDTTTGHWEIAGLPLDEPFATFERFPPEIVGALEKASGVSFLGNYAQSGTVILAELGDEHVRTGQPILYTSADSVLQIAAHEDVVPLDDLYRICRIARKIADDHRIGRVIARPFTGTSGRYQRTANRRDFSLVPARTVLDALTERGVPVIGVGKISDIFAGKGISLSCPTHSNLEGMDRIADCWEETENGLIFANLVDFDMLYGHRRDIVGYANALREFDDWLGRFFGEIGVDDLVLITADHGNDPTWTGTDHTRECVPLLARAPGLAGNLGVRRSFADVAATLADWFGLEAWPRGKSLL
ncbi:MAG: phosphopentomutase [Akkermansiaceae bacterium]|nr:phosphopentomutase [Akkermansiaceae bacterium]